MADDDPDVRVGTAEREQALSTLGDHFAAGRLTPSEFDERSAAVASAVTRGELASVFTDLPVAGDSFAGSAQPSAPVPRPDAAPVAEGTTWDWRAAVVGVTPIVALVLFFTVGSWLWFLMIPAVGALLYAGDKRGRDKWRP